MLKITQLLLLALAVGSLPSLSPASESELQKKDGLSVQLVTDATSVTPGKPLRIGLVLDPEEGYHTYWKGPGIVGVATTVEWTLPDGFAAGDLIWPAPERVDMVGINAHGYYGKACLITEIQVPESIEADSVTFGAKAAWMCCATSCYPGFTDLELTLPVNHTGKAGPVDQEYSKLFEDSLNSVPPMAPNDWTISARIVNPEVIELELTIPDLAENHVDDVYFFSNDLQVNSEEPQVVALSGQENPKLKFTLIRSDFAPKGAKELAGVVYHPKGWPGLDSRYAEISFTWPGPTFQK